MTLRKTHIILLISMILYSCSHDCDPDEVEDKTRYLSVTGNVINAQDKIGVKGVRLSMLDQIGGSFIINWDTLQYSGNDGCFQYKAERDISRLNDYLDTEPSLSLDQINQSIRPFKSDYYYHYSKQGSDFINSWTRWIYESSIAVEMYVSPAATIKFEISDSSLSELAFRWSFTDPSLKEFNIAGGFRIDSEICWDIPAGQEILIEITSDFDQESIYETNITPVAGEVSVVQF